jgi:hypothetical protein
MLRGNVAGGLGVDTEFFDSILVPNVMLHGFLGLQPSATGVASSRVCPKLGPA